KFSITFFIASSMKMDSLLGRKVERGEVVLQSGYTRRRRLASAFQRGEWCVISAQLTVTI
ncbi:MAG: hypothetical protein ABI583_13470, partial [Betaproteobacteria bacterium]